MSRTSTTSGAATQTGKSSQPAAASHQQMQMPQACIPADKVAARAYDKWVKNGCKHGNDKKDWLEAEAEIKAEMSRNAKK